MDLEAFARDLRGAASDVRQVLYPFLGVLSAIAGAAALYVIWGCL